MYGATPGSVSMSFAFSSRATIETICLSSFSVIDSTSSSSCKPDVYLLKRNLFFEFFLPSALNGLSTTIPLLFRSHLIEPLSSALLRLYFTLSLMRNLFSLVSSSGM